MLIVTDMSLAYRPLAGANGCNHASVCRRGAGRSEPERKGERFHLCSATFTEICLPRQWLIPWAREERCYNEQAYDEKLAGRLWDWLEEQVKEG